MEESQSSTLFRQGDRHTVQPCKPPTKAINEHAIAWQEGNITYYRRLMLRFMEAARVDSNARPDWLGKTGTIVQIDRGKGKPEAQVAIATGSKSWATFQWLEAVAPPEIEEAIAPCEEGDYVRGQNLKDGSWIEGEATAIGRKYVQLDHTNSKAILIETLEILRPAIPEPPQEQEAAITPHSSLTPHPS